MAEFTQAFLQGSSENFSTTIRAMVGRDWDSTKTQNKTPLFISGELSTRTKNRTELAETITFDEGSTIPLADGSALDDSQMEMATQILINIYASNQYRRTIFQNEINRIVRKNRPSKNIRIKKENNTQDSAINEFIEILPQWSPIDFEIQKSKRDASLRFNDFEMRKNLKSSRSQAVLTALWENQWTI